MIRAAVVIILLALSCAAVAQESDATGIFVGQQLGVRGGQTVTLNLMPGGQATIAITHYQGEKPLISRGTWRLEGSGFVRVDIAGMAGTGTLYFHRYSRQLVATQDPFELGGFPLQLNKLPAAAGTYTAVRTGAGGLQRLTLQLDANGTATLRLQQRTPEEKVTVWQGNWQVQPTGDIEITLRTNSGNERMTLAHDAGMLRALEWNRSSWGTSPLVFVRE